MKKYLIIGGAGFAGSGIVKKLLNKDYKVEVLDVVQPLDAWNLWEIKEHPNLSYNWKALQDVTPKDIDGFDVVVNLAAQPDVPMGFPSPRWTVEQNVMGAINLLEAVKEVQIDRLLYAGSGNEYGRPLYLPIDEKHPLTPHNPYAFSKAAAEMALRAYERCYNVPIVLMSNGACCGKGMRREIFVFKWLYNILRGKPIYLEGGDQTRDLTYVSDILDAWDLVIEAPGEKVIGEKFQVSYGKEETVEDLLKMCFEVCGVSMDDYPIEKRAYRPGEKGQRECFDTTKARNVLGYNPKVSPLEGIRLTKEWIRKELI